MNSSPLRERIAASRLPIYVPPAAAAVMTLTPDMCRWPLGDVADPAFRFCCAPRERDRYCAAHARLAGRTR